MARVAYGRGYGRGLPALALLAAVAISVGACTAGVAPSGSLPPASSGPPSAAPVASPGVPASPTSQACSRDTFPTATDELIAAIGNPDTDTPSEASQAFDDALASGDPAAIQATGAVVLEHLALGHAAIAAPPAGADEPLAVACSEWEEMLGDIEEGVALTRDGGVAGSNERVEAGRALVVGALQDHFWQASRGNNPTMFIEYTADGRAASSSRSRLTTGAAQAFDGNPETAWTTGDALPPQWVEIDLGWQATIAGVRLVAFRDGDGATDHAVTVRDASGTERELTRFTGNTRDRDTLEYLAPSPVANVQVLRVTTEQAAGTIGWREIEVVLAPGSSPSPCAASDTPIGGLTAAGGPPSSVTTPDMAIDGDPATAWDPGQSGSLSVQLARPALVSALRVLIGEVPAGAPGWFVQVFNGTRWMRLGHVMPDEAVGGWLTIPGPAPCVAVSGVQLAAWAVEPNPPIRELEILGSTAGGDG